MGAYWRAVFRRASDETHMVGVVPFMTTVGVSILALFAQAKMEIVPWGPVWGFVLTLLGSYAVVSVFSFAINAVRAPALLDADRRKELAACEGKLREGEATAPTLELGTPWPYPNNQPVFGVVAHMTNPGPATTTKGDWVMVVTKANGQQVPPIYPMPEQQVHLPAGLPTRHHLVFPYSVEIPTITDLDGARLVITVTDIHGHTLRGEYPMTARCSETA